FQDVQDTKGLDLFSWNPCTQFTEGDCSNVAVRLLWLRCFALVTVLSRANSDICTKTSACSCTYSDGSTVDLSPLDSSGGTPRFYDVLDDQRVDMFSWNPCTPFSEGSCNNVAVCQKRTFIPNPEYYSLGDQNSAVFANDNTGKPTLSYKAVQGGVSRTSIITLTCEQQTDGILLAAGEKEPTKYYMELKSKYACPKVGPTVTPTTQHGGGNETKGGLSIGTVLFLSEKNPGAKLFQIFLSGAKYLALLKMAYCLSFGRVGDLITQKCDGFKDCAKEDE
ncbi:hypothetical protein ACJMK2_024286, partial [Sinanodonta woodiana]